MYTLRLFSIEILKYKNKYSLTTSYYSTLFCSISNNRYLPALHSDFTTCCINILTQYYSLQKAKNERKNDICAFMAIKKKSFIEHDVE